MCFQGYSISPEDYTSLWGWITFSWVYPLVRRVILIFFSTKVFLLMLFYRDEIPLSMSKTSGT